MTFARLAPFLCLWYVFGLLAWVAFGLAVYWLRIGRIMWLMLHGARIAPRDKPVL